MKFVAITYGTEGDTRPLVALCRALMDRGHSTELLADGATLGTAAALGVPTKVLAGDIRDVLQPENAIATIVDKGQSFRDTASGLASIANASAEAWLRELMAAGRGADALLISGLASFIGLSAGEALKIPSIGVGFIPISPTSAFPSPFLPPQKIPRLFNRVSHHLVNGLLWRAFRKATNEARAKVCNLPPRRKVWTSHPVLFGVSPSILPQPADWPSYVRICGQWIPQAPHWSAPQALADFLAAGEAPMYIGFGSMGIDRSGMLQEIITAAAGRRTLLYAGWSKIDVAQLPANFFLLGDTPHDWLLPRTSLIVHHGGSGTTHSAARSGVPSVVVPFAADQFFWADRLQQLGVAPAAVNAKDLTATALARAIVFAERTEVRSRAVALGERMRSEDGLAIAIAAIETLASAGRRQA